MKYRVIFLFLLAYQLSFAVREETASLKGFFYGTAPACSYDNYLSHTVERIAREGYNVYAPWDRQTEGFGQFTFPTTEQDSLWAIACTEFIEENFAAAEQALAEAALPYEIVLFHDTDTGRDYYMLRELLNHSYYDDNGTTTTVDDERGSFDYGWGVFLIDTQSTVRVIESVVHPNDDFIAVPLAVYALDEIRPKYFLVSGAGREVAFSGGFYSSNSVSLSDPSRNWEHPFNTMYEKMCVNIRTALQGHELSLQIHSYDWTLNSYPVQISPVRNNACPGLPMRDMSSFRNDVINNSPRLIHSAAELGLNQDILVNDYYALLNQSTPFYWGEGEEALLIGGNLDYNGYRGFQVSCSQYGIGDYDVFEPFFHIEMNELPKGYTRDLATYYDFYGYNEADSTFNLSTRFTKALNYYRPWVDALAASIPATMQMNDHAGLSVADPVLTSCNTSWVQIGWEMTDCYDFYTYEVYLEGLGDSTIVFDRSRNETLAWAGTTNFDIGGLTSGNNYAVYLRARDYNGNVSAPSAILNFATGYADISNFKAVGKDGLVTISFSASAAQGSLRGFGIKRAERQEGPYETLADYTTTAVLNPPQNTSASYTWNDSSAVNGIQYYYRLSVTTSAGITAENSLIATAAPERIYRIYVRQTDGTYSDSLFFGYNRFATDGYDYDYDYSTYDSSFGNYFFAQFPLSNRNLYMSIKNYYVPTDTAKDWSFRVKTNQLGNEIQISCPEQTDYPVYIFADNQLTEITQNTFRYQPVSTDYQYFTLVFGRLSPGIDGFSNFPTFVNAQAEFSWQLLHPEVAQSMSVYAFNEERLFSIGIDLPVADSIIWDVPEEFIANLRLRIELTDIYGRLTSYESPNSFCTVPSTLPVSYEEGWQLKSNPAMNYTGSGGELYGAGSYIFSYVGEEYQLLNAPGFGLGYWLYASAPGTAAIDNPQYTDTHYQQSVNEGWALLPNPFPFAYSLKQLHFLVQNSSYTYAEAVENSIIEAYAYNYDKGFYCSDTLQTNGALLLKIKRPGMTITYDFAAPVSEPVLPEITQRIIIKATIDSLDYDYIGLNFSSQTEEELVSGLDKLAPPPKPFAQKTDFNIIYDEQTLLKERGELPRIWGSGQEILLLCRLQVFPLLPVTFTLAEMPFEGVYVYCDTPSGRQLLTTEEPLTFLPTGFDSEITFTIVDNPQTVSDINTPIKPLTCYPNPFNPQISIAFGLKQAGDVDLRIYNVRGQLVSTLQHGLLEGGNHRFVWQGKTNVGKQAASGIYFVKLVKEGKCQIKKVVLLK